MRILLTADTHDIVPTQVLDLAGESDLVVHAGDFTTTEIYDEFSKFDLKAVHGNVDDPKIVEKLPESLVFEVEGHRFGVVHETGLAIDDTTPAYYLAKEMGVDVLLYGHSHTPRMEKSDVLLINPGSPTRPRLSDPAVAILEVDETGVRVFFREIKGDACGFIGFSRGLR